MLKKVAVSVVAAGLLTACAAVWDHESVGKMVSTGSAFDAALQKSYVALAAYEQGGGDWDSVAYYTGKARAAAQGRTPQPTALAERDLKGYHGAIEKARADLVGALSAGAGSVNPVMAAKAQTSFDCWAEEASEGRQPDRIEGCKQDFLIALRALPTAAVVVPARSDVSGFLIHFALGGASLGEDARSVLDDIAQGFMKEVPARVLVVGHTDTAGAADANILLSQRRAETVARALALRGIASEVMTLEAYGEERLVVATPDGVAEPQNRRVEITFEK